MPIQYLKQIQLGKFNNNGYRIAPSQEVESIVEGFYVFSSDQTEDSHLIFNDGFPVLVFLPGIDDSITITTESNTFDVKSAWASAGAIRNVYVKYNVHADQVFVIRFHPGAFYQLFGLDTQHFRYKPIIPFAEIAETCGFKLTDFFNCSSINDKVGFAESHIQNSFSGIKTPDVLHQSLNYIRNTKGQSTVQNVTRDIGVNYKWLERNFAKNIGLLPKEYILLQRFLHTYIELVDSKGTDLMFVAISNGYYDYNHFLKDFKAYTGKAPLEYLKFRQSFC
ncbi:helix-turn-helix domain-containing protein [Pedobacter nyackensis]|uniref:AraC-type DNA-binding protein n=1 Tax=Pedobacter nyackensis TaxID=475255 RepID=A0A1W2EJM6_9SPHI|nr:helix-turn-helix domain-containing protein [Pedobacter nyackensis]SMD09910.1 AraC-type DNA-binding protein [Pedobacter nyackensis]